MTKLIGVRCDQCGTFQETALSRNSPLPHGWYVLMEGDIYANNAVDLTFCGKPCIRNWAIGEEPAHSITTVGAWRSGETHE